MSGGLSYTGRSEKASQVRRCLSAGLDDTEEMSHAAVLKTSDQAEKTVVSTRVFCTCKEPFMV